MSTENARNHSAVPEIVRAELVRDPTARRAWLPMGLALGFATVATAAAVLVAGPIVTALATDPAVAQTEAEAPPATPVSVAVLKSRDTMKWDEFSGRLQAVERVELRPRVAGAVKAVHFREGAIVKEGDLLVTIDPEPYVAALNRAQALEEASKAQVEFSRSELDRGKQLVDNKVVSVRDLDQRTNTFREAEANLRAAEAAVQTAQLDLNYTEVRAPVDGRIGRLNVTVGNLVVAGPTSPVLTTLVSVNPIYVGFDADEAVVSEALASIEGDDPLGNIDAIPVEIVTSTTGSKPARGKLQLVDNQVDAATGTFRLRAVFDNADGRLVPGQFARVKMGRARSEPALVINERAIGTDQDKKFVFVVDGESKASYREVKLGPPSEGLRVVTSGLKDGDRVVVNGLQRVRPGALLAPEDVPMESASANPAAPAVAAVQ